MTERAQPTSTPAVCLGVVAAAHGVRGEVKVKTFTARPEDIVAYGPLSLGHDGRTVTARVVRSGAKGMVVLRLSGVTDRSAAEALAGAELRVPRQALPPVDEDEFYYADLIGLLAKTPAGESLGTVRGVADYGAGDVMELEGGALGPLVVPFTRQVVPHVDVAGGEVTVALPAGLAPNEDDNDEDSNGAGRSQG